MPAAVALSGEHSDQVNRFLAAMRGVGLTPWRSTEQAARTLCAKLERAGGWHRLSLTAQVNAAKKAPTFAAWLILTGQLRVTGDFLGAVNLRGGHRGPSLLPPHLHLVRGRRQAAGCPPG
jgi:integrase/recombinase XerD